MSFEFVTYKGKRIALVDIADSSPDQAAAVLAEARASIAALPAGSGLLLTDASDADLDAATSATVRDFTESESPAVKAAAVVGLEGLRALALTAAAWVAGRRVRACRDRVEALEWLASLA